MDLVQYHVRQDPVMQLRVIKCHVIQYHVVEHHVIWHCVTEHVTNAIQYKTQGARGRGVGAEGIQ